MRQQNAEVDFSGQTVYVGIDVGKKSWKVCIIVGDREHRTFSQDPDGAMLGRYVHRHFPNARYRCVYEAGYFGFAPHASLVAAGLECIVVSPGDVPTMNKERVTKTDQIDARKLARGLQAGMLTAIYVPDRVAQGDRSLVRSRQRFIQKQTRCKNQIKAHLRMYGIELPEGMVDRHWSRAYIAWLETIAAQEHSEAHALRLVLEELMFHRGQILKVTRAIRTLGQTARYRARLEALCAHRGIGVITGMVLLTELIDIHRFRSDDALASFIGLVPGEYSSGEQRRVGAMTHRGSAWLRHVMIEAAWRASAEDPVLLKKYLAKKAKKGPQLAIVGVARTLVRHVRYTLKHIDSVPTTA